eukprot:g20635.t1
MLLESGTQTIELITKGRERGLFNANSQIFTHSVLSDMDVSGVDPDVLRGVVTVSYFPDYSMLFTEVGRNFSMNWHKMSPFGDCNTVVDSQGATYLKNKHTGACADLDFAAYRDGNETLNVYAGHTYDAAYAAAYTLDYLVRNNMPLAIENVKDAVVEHLDFPGAAYPPYAFDGAPEIVKIGGLFAAILEDGGEIDVVQAELLAAFIMAINELNNKTDEASTMLGVQT